MTEPRPLEENEETEPPPPATASTPAGEPGNEPDAPVEPATTDSSEPEADQASESMDDADDADDADDPDDADDEDSTSDGRDAADDADPPDPTDAEAPAAESTPADDPDNEAQPEPDESATPEPGETEPDDRTAPEDEPSREPDDEAGTAVEAAKEPTPEPDPPPAPARPPRQRLAVRYRAAALIGALTAALGFAIAVQVHANSQADSLSNLRADDLIGILDNQNARGDRLRQQINELEQTLRRLQDSGDRNAAARQQAEEDAQALGVLLGTLPATGPGVSVTITDPNGKLQAEDLLDVVEELRGAGAEAIQFGTRRVSTSTAFTTKDGAVAVDGAVQPAPYTVLAIGDPKTLDTALNIPGGVAAAVRAAGGQLTVSEQETVTITVTRSLPAPKYASPSSH